jgi:hypothetical protein
MPRTGLHPGLEIRADLLSARITDLRRKMKRDTGIAQVDDRIEIEQLERRRKTLEQRMAQLDREGDTYFAGLKSAMAQVAFDTACSVDAFMRRLDANYRRRPH